MNVYRYALVAYAPAALPNPSTAAHAALDGEVAGVFLFDLQHGTLIFGDGFDGGFAVGPDGSVGPLAYDDDEGGHIEEEDSYDVAMGTTGGEAGVAGEEGAPEASAEGAPAPEAAPGPAELGGEDGGEGITEEGADAAAAEAAMTGPAPISAPHVKPRLFVVYPGQECFFEVLSAEAFSQYAASRAGDGSCTVTAAPVAGPEGGVDRKSVV